ncbi:MAG: methanogenesis marker protein Mmp4/MtxX [Methanoregulaceae archaeon]|nr:methanogenesis marker protein Mmp4/MtxX [Methanoregulaceae archaeon]
MSIIGIGTGENVAKVLMSIEHAHLQSQIACYCKTGTVFPKDAPVIIRESKDPPQEIVGDLMSGRIDAAVRGTLPANETLKALKVASGREKLERIAFLETPSGRKFLLAPVGVDEGWTVSQKISFIEKGRVIAEKFGLPAGVGVISGGRYGDLGRLPQVDRSLAQGELVARLSGARHYEILIEDAIKDCGLIIAPDGISGNLIFRTLILLGGGTGHGAPVVNIDKIFIDTSRASPDYAYALMLAESLRNQ